jgi:hypothetical protein
VFYAELPPIQVIVPTPSPWSTWLPITISSAALLVTSVSALLSHRDRERAKPLVEMSVVYADQMLMGSLTRLKKVVGLHFDNRGREDTNITSLEIISSGGTIITGFNMLLDDDGNQIAQDGRYEPLPGFGGCHLYIDASVIQGEEILVIAGFGHGLQIAAHAPMGRLNNRKPLSAFQQHRITCRWERNKKRAAKSRARAQPKP